MWRSFVELIQTCPLWSWRNLMIMEALLAIYWLCTQQYAAATVWTLCAISSAFSMSRKPVAPKADVGFRYAIFLCIMFVCGCIIGEYLFG